MPLQHGLLRRLGGKAVPLEPARDRVAERLDPAEPLELAGEVDAVFVRDAEARVALGIAAGLREVVTVDDLVVR